MTVLEGVLPQQERALPDLPSWRRNVLLLAVGSLLSIFVAVAGHRYFVDPFSTPGQVVPLVGAAVLVLAVGAIALRGYAWAADAGAILVSAWVSWFGASQLYGTPFPYGGMQADIARLAAAATKYSVHVASTDQLVKGLPTEYPPLFPWLVGRVSAFTDLPAWRLVGVSSVIFCGVAALIGYLLWRRLVPPLTALAVCLIPAAVYGDPRKAHEVAALCVLTPWVLAGLARFRRATPALPWFITGIIGGLLVTTYQGYLFFALAGLVVIVALGLRRAPRWPYVRYLMAATAMALLTSAWFLLPWASGLLRTGGDDSADLFKPFEIAIDRWHLPWQHQWPVALILTSGTILLAYHAWRQDWARYLLALALSAMGYRWIMLIRYDRTGHTSFLHYTDRFYDGVLATGLVLSLVMLWPGLRARGPLSGMRRGGARVAAVLSAVSVALVSMTFYWDAHRAGHPDNPHTPNFTRLAHATALPSGKYPRFSAEAAPRTARFPAPEVRRIVESQFGRNAVPTTLTYNESLSSYYPYYQYVGVGANSANSLALWRQRANEVQRLSEVHDPALFALKSAQMQYGSIDAFVLREDKGWFTWRDVRFSSSQLAEPYFHAARAQGGTWVFTRVGAKVEHTPYPR